MTQKGFERANTLKADASAMRQAEVARRYLTGESMVAISKTMGVGIRTVYRDLERAREVWKANAEQEYGRKLPEKLAQLAAVRGAAWEGWKRSLRDERTRTHEEGTSSEGAYSKTRSQRKGQSGNPAFLVTIHNCLQTECKLMGLLESDAGSDSVDSPRVITVVVDSVEQRDLVLSMSQFKEKVVEDA